MFRHGPAALYVDLRRNKKNAAKNAPATTRLNHNSCDAPGSAPFATKIASIAAIAI